MSAVEVNKRHTVTSVREVQKCADDKTKQVNNLKKYKKIPITRAEEEQYRNGKRVFCAFHSRNSDTWLRGLK